MSTAAAAENDTAIELDDEAAIDDVPDDFFEDFEKNEFLDGLEVLDDLSPDGGRPRRRSMSGYSSESSNFGLVEKQSHVLNEIKKLERDIAERRRKLCRARSPALRSPTSRQRRRSLSRRRQSARSRSRSRGRRNRPPSRSRNRRSRSRGRPNRNQVLPARRRERPKSREKTDMMGRKSISFLEELSQKFAEQGKAFPEAEGFDINATNNYNMPANNFVNHPMGPYPMFNPMMAGPQPPPSWLGFNNPSLMGPGPPGIAMMPDSTAMQQMMMPPREQPPVVSMDLESSNSNERMETPPPPSIVKREFEEPGSRYCDTDEMIRKTFRESVLTRCRDVVNLLKASETQLVKPPNLHYIPTVISATLPNDNFLSPLQSINNVKFSFDDKDNAPSYLKRLSGYTSNIVHTLGFNIKTAQFTVALPSVDESPLPEEAVPVDIKFDIGTQTEPVKCDRCHENDLREFKDKTTQVAAVTYHIGCQTSNEDPYSFAEMTPAQVVAISDFGKILKNGLMPTNYREATDLRDRLFNIYQTCTGLNKDSFLRDNEHRINPGIFRDTSDRVVEPMRDNRMVQNSNDMMRSAVDRFDNRQRSIEPQRNTERQRSLEPQRGIEQLRYEQNRLDRGDQSFSSRQSDPFQSNNMFNMSSNTQDRFMQTQNNNDLFMQTQNNDRFDSMSQHDQYNPMRNSDPRGMPQQNQNDFGNRMSDAQSMSSNRYDANQDRFSSLNSSSMNQQQQQQQTNTWGGGQQGSRGQSLSSLSPLGNNLRPAANEDFARRPGPQPLFPDTASGVMTCKQIMEMERGSGNRIQGSNQQNINMQFDNNNLAGRNHGGGGGSGGAGGIGGGRGNRGGGGAPNRNQQQNRSNRGGGGNRF